MIGDKKELEYEQSKRRVLQCVSHWIALREVFKEQIRENKEISFDIHDRKACDYLIPIIEKVKEFLQPAKNDFFDFVLKGQKYRVFFMMSKEGQEDKDVLKDLKGFVQQFCAEDKETFNLFIVMSPLNKLLKQKSQGDVLDLNNAIPSFQRKKDNPKGGMHPKLVIEYKAMVDYQVLHKRDLDINSLRFYDIVKGKVVRKPFAYTYLQIKLLEKNYIYEQLGVNNHQITKIKTNDKLLQLLNIGELQRLAEKEFGIYTSLMCNYGPSVDIRVVEEINTQGEESIQEDEEEDEERDDEEEEQEQEDQE